MVVELMIGRKNTKLIAITVIGLAILAGGGLWWNYAAYKGVKRGSSGAQTQSEIFASYAGSESCRECHSAAYDFWKSSHHALAERRMDHALDRPAFDPPRTLKHGTQSSEMRVDPNFQYVVVTMSTNGERRSFPVERVIGVDPLRQYLVQAPGGRMQVTEIASDPKKGDWFDVFGEENRVSGEWGHWTGRGMTWNFMCASCHNTRLRKNYDECSDRYTTAMVEMGVGCEACHGPMAQHVAWQRKYQPAGKNQKAVKADPTLVKFSRDQYRDTCGTCHSRRSEITSEFRPGESFVDNYALTIPDETDLFYPDGQIRDEDYEFGPFVGSRMHAGGVRCFDCHEPHSAKVKGQGNSICMTCHIKGGTMTNSPVIDPLAHGHHPLDKGGSLCTDCHMPQTPYMQRHWRHDHGFTIPDPLLTKQYGIPNACNRCHKDKDVAWALEAVEKWYGKRMERPSRTRAQVVAQARAGKHEAVPGLLGLLKQEERYPLWRAVAAGMLKRWAYEPEVTKRLLEQTADPEPLVRSLAVRALESVVQLNPAVPETLQRLTSDPVRLVRIDAAWALRASLDTNTLAGRDLLAYLRQNIDQPSGALQMGVFLLDRGDTEPAIAYFRKAVSWDTNSAPLHHALAVGLSMQGKTAEAIASLETACRLAPRDAEYWFKLGLAYNEANRVKAAVLALEQATKLDPEFPQAWYNLGLAYSATDQLEEAAAALNKAETLDPSAPRIPYARATVLAKMGQVNPAKAAVQRALEIQPNFPEAVNLFRVLSLQAKE